MKETTRKYNYKDLINLIILLLFLPCAFYIMNGVYVFGDEPMRQLPNSIFLYLGLASITLFSALIIFNIVAKRYRPSLPTVIMFGTLFIANACTILFFKSPHTFFFNVKGINYDIYYFVSLERKLIYVLQFFIILCVMFLILDFLPKSFPDYNYLYLLSIGVIIYALTCVVISFITESEFYITLIPKLLVEDSQFNYPQSILPNKNSYALILFLGLVASLFLHSRKYHFYWFIPACFFLTLIVFSFCKTLIIISPIYFLLYLFIRFILSIKENPLRNTIALTIVLLLIGIFIAVVFFLIEAAPGVETYIHALFDFNNLEYGSIASRIDIWMHTFALLGQSSALFGVGYNLYGNILYEFMLGSDVQTIGQQMFAHNITIEALGNGGLLLLSASITILLYAIYLGIKLFKNYKNLVISTFLLILALLVYGCVESGTFLFPYNIDFAYLSAIVFIPLFFKKRELKKVLF